MLEFVYDLTGYNHFLTMDLPIEPTKRIEKGEPVRITAGKISNSASGAYIGVANETHSGEYDMFNPRSNGDVLSVIITHKAVYATDYPIATFNTAGTNETTATYPISPDHRETDLLGARFTLIEKGPSSGNTDKIGDTRYVTAYVYQTMTMTLTPGGVIGVGDKYAFMPPVVFKKLEYDPTTHKIYVSNNAGDFIVVGEDRSTNKMLMIFRNPQLY